MAFAIIKTGGKQYKVAKGDILKIEKIPDQEEGSKIGFKEVLLIDDESKTVVGYPLVKGALVDAEVKKIAKEKKVISVKFKPKSNKTGTVKNHRQTLMTIEIGNIKN